MKLLFKQRFLSWFDSYDIFGEDGEIFYRVEGRLAWGHRLEIYAPLSQHLGTLQQEVFTFLPRFRMIVGGQQVGEIRKELTFLKPRFQLDCNGWTVVGDFLEWEYEIRKGDELIATASKQIWNFTDTYEIDVMLPENALYALMVVLAIDAVKCSSGS